MFYKIIPLTQVFLFFFYLNCFAASVKQPEFAGQFYPAQKEELSTLVDNFLIKAQPKNVSGDIFMLISPHAGYGFSGQTAAFGYKLIKNKNYKTVIIFGASHHKVFNGTALYGPGTFVTSLGQINVDEEFLANILNRDPEVFVDTSVFSNEHSIEV